MKSQKLISAFLIASLLTAHGFVGANAAEKISISDFSIDSDTVNAQLSSEDCTNTTALVAIFDYSGRLVRTASTDVKFTDGTASVEIPVTVSDTENCKLMLLESIDGIKPLSEASVIKSKSSFTDKLNRLMPENENYMFSPLSIKMALAMVANGAEGKTQNEILNATGISSLSDYNNYVKKMIDTYSLSEGLSLNISNSIWLNTDNSNDSFSETFTQTIADYYNGTASTVNNTDFVDKINGWVNEKTNGKIPTLVSENNKFITFIANAIYFKGTWEDKFNESSTQPEIFTDRNNKETEIDFMKRTDMISYYDKNGVQMVRLPYKNHFRVDGISYRINADIKMYLILSENDNINVDSVIFDGVNNGDFTLKYVNLWVPKFEFEFGLGTSSPTEFKDMLKAIGIRRMFIPFADSFTECAQFNPMMTTNEDMIYIDTALHKTFISVDEEGTEAAAVTGFGGGAGAAPIDPTPPPTPIIFHADKPFTFVIRDDSRDEVLFIGEYAFAE